MGNGDSGKSLVSFWTCYTGNSRWASQWSAEGTIIYRSLEFDVCEGRWGWGRGEAQTGRIINGALTNCQHSSKHFIYLVPRILHTTLGAMSYVPD